MTENSQKIIDGLKNSAILNFSTLESGINVPLHLFIFGIFSRGYGLITDFKDEFVHFKGLRLSFWSNFPEATFILGAASIPDSRLPKMKR